MIKFLDLQKVNARYADELQEATRRVIDRGWYLQGEECERFETEYAQYIGTRYCVSCASGLDALILMLRALPDSTTQAGVLQGVESSVIPNYRTDKRTGTFNPDESCFDRCGSRGSGNRY